MFTHQWSLAEQFAAADQIANCHVEIVISTAPVWNPCEWVCHENLLQMQTYDLIITLTVIRT